MAKTISLFRHTLPVEPEENTCRGAGIDVPLSDIGIRQMEQNVQFLIKTCGGNLDDLLVVTSPLERTSHFGSFLYKSHGVEHVREKKLTDIDAGFWEGKKWDDIKVDSPIQHNFVLTDARKLKIPGAKESVENFERRTLDSFYHLIHTSTAGHIAFCLHRCSNNVILSSIDKRKLTFAGQKMGCMNELYLDDAGNISIILEDQIVYRHAIESVLQPAH